MSAPSSQEADDQDFQPNKRPRTQIKLNKQLVPSEQVSGAVSQFASSHVAGKENQSPIESCAKHCLQPGAFRQQSLSSDCETLPLRQSSHLQFPRHKASANLDASTSVRCQTQFQEGSSLSVRSFFTKPRSKPSWNQKALPGGSLSQGNAPDTACQLGQLSYTTQSAAQPKHTSHETSSSSLQLSQPGTVCASGPACPSSPACTAGSAGPEYKAMPACIAGQTPSPLPGNFIVLDASDSDEEASDDGEFADLQTQAVQSEQAVLSWLRQHGLATYAAAFSQAEVDMNLLPCLTDSDLKQMGVAALGPRRKILAAAAKLSLQNGLDESDVHAHCVTTAPGAVRTYVACQLMQSVSGVHVHLMNLHSAKTYSVECSMSAEQHAGTALTATCCISYRQKVAHCACALSPCCPAATAIASQHLKHTCSFLGNLKTCTCLQACCLTPAPR